MENKQTTNTDNDYIDVAKNADYQNQSPIYYREFLNWRSTGNNQYAYSFVRHKKEHTYIDGKGFVSKTPADVEKKVLKRCCSLLAMSLIAFLIVSIGEIIFISNYMGKLTFSLSRALYSEPLNLNDVPFRISGIICLFRIAKYLLPILIFKLDSGLPKEVMLPKSAERHQELSMCAIVFCMLMLVICRFANRGFAEIADLLGIGVYQFEFLYSSDKLSMLIFAFVECIVTAILIEVFFRGLVLQTFRQFGDMFAFIVCCIANAFSTLDATSIGYTVFISIIITMFTLRTGSIATAIIMRISINILNFVFSLMALYISSDYAKIAEYAVCIIIIAASLIIYSRMTNGQSFSFNINNSKTQLTISKKFIVLLSSSPFTLWIILIMFFCFFTIRIV